MNIYQKLNEVRKAVDYVRKDKKVGEGGYLAVTHDAVTALTREHFIAKGIVIVPCFVSSSVQPTGTTTAKGVPFIRYEAIYRFTVVNSDDPAEQFAFEIQSHALDQGDKAPGKALSYAKKYAVLKLLEIESGEDADEEERPTQKAEAKITPNAGAGDDLTRKQKGKVEELAGQVIDFFSADRLLDAFTAYESGSADWDVEEKVYLWTFFDSTQRATIKRLGEQKRKRELELHPATQG